MTWIKLQSNLVYWQHQTESLYSYSCRGLIQCKCVLKTRLFIRVCSLSIWKGIDVPLPVGHWMGTWCISMMRHPLEEWELTYLRCVIHVNDNAFFYRCQGRSIRTNTSLPWVWIRPAVHFWREGALVAWARGVGGTMWVGRTRRAWRSPTLLATARTPLPAGGLWRRLRWCWEDVLYIDC